MNNAKKRKNPRLGVTAFRPGDKEIEFPPQTTNEYPISISERALREYIVRGGEVLVIPVEEGKKKDKRVESKKREEEVAENNL